ncbi:VOC family protein [Streptomyces sp. MMBL 11-3]|uniref:VOC family protein n=1 Tax=Streptomyces sp. MMBL 11-3 TaxID=3382639 RepID=UPI0039B6DACE
MPQHRRGGQTPCDEPFGAGHRPLPRRRRRRWERVPEGRAAKNRLHLDVSPVDRSTEDEVARLLALGAGKTDVGQGAGRTWEVVADPEDNEFCVLRTPAP